MQGGEGSQQESIFLGVPSACKKYEAHGDMRHAVPATQTVICWLAGVDHSLDLSRYRSPRRWKHCLALGHACSKLQSMLFGQHAIDQH